MRHVSLFAGIGGMDLAAEWAGFETVLFCEKDPYCQKVLAKHWPGVPIIDDIRSVTRESIDGAIDVISGGPPCQPTSTAGKRGGTGDDRWLWPEMLRVICELAPAWVVAENVPGLLSIERGMVFETVLSDLESAGYETLPLVYPACGVGANHRRNRVFILAHSKREERRTGAEVAGVLRALPENGAESNNANRPSADVADAAECGREEGDKDAGGGREGTGEAEERGGLAIGGWWQIKCGLGGMADELPAVVDGRGWWGVEPDIPRVSKGAKNRTARLRALGNAVVPQQAYPIFAAIGRLYDRG